MKIFTFISIDVYQKATLYNIILKFSSLISSIQTRTYHLAYFTSSNKKIFGNIINENETKEENIYFLKILEIRKNEHFDDILMFLNKLSTLSIKEKQNFMNYFI